MFSPNETVVVVSFTTQIGEISGMINICIPHIVLEPIIPKLSVHYWMETTAKEQDPETFDTLSNHLKQIQVETKTLLGETKITLNELLHLKEDDVIALNQSIDEPLQLIVNNTPKMLVQAGKINNRIAVQVLEEIKEGSLP